MEGIYGFMRSLIIHFEFFHFTHTHKKKTFYLKRSTKDQKTAIENT